MTPSCVSRQEPPPGSRTQLAPEPLVDELCSLFVLCRQLYAQEAACRLQAAEREGEALQGLSKEEYLKMMLPDSPPGEDKRRHGARPSRRT